MPVSVSTETSAICTPPTPPDISPPGFLGSLTPISEMVVAPSLEQAAFQVRLLAGLPLTWTLPSTASSCSLGTPSEGATASNSVPSATPSGDGQAQAALDGTGLALAARMPLLFPIHQLGALLELQPVDVAP